ncbi:MAG: hypothetical protein OXU92_04375 [Deltaproteobacteria bacterium]|nr:hypothetical protein [Deltaproteobacteria bacterium]
MATRKEENAAVGMLTYANYAHAFCLYPATLHDLEEAQNALPGFRNLQQSKQATEVLKRHLHRGFMTLQYIKKLPVENMPEIEMAAALWIPVLVYYAVHGFGLAALAALHGDNLPKKHAKFIRAAGKQPVCSLLPDPFVARLTGGFKGDNFTNFNAENLVGLHLDCEPDNWPSHHKIPTPKTRISHIARCLSTTRRRQLNKRFASKRREENIKTLPPDEKMNILNKFSDTTVFDYLYRMREHSNYDNPKLFALGPENKSLALRFVNKNRENAIRLCHLLLRIIERRLKKDEYTKLVEDWQVG